MKLDHIGIAVKDLEESRKFYGQVLGLKVSEPEDLPDRQLKICMVDMGVGGANIELLWPTHPDSAVAKFIDKKGPGMHHICYRVDDVAKKLEEIKAAGVKLIDEAPKPGAHHTLVAFIHPKSSGGVLTELSQPA
ncbi:MAG: methylmalonyl-CoA epimerase [Deltaproteobacteria bacterium]|nr:methylmalonyl-CoA epimerase [Deltaproteobacteria bacterium]